MHNVVEGQMPLWSLLLTSAIVLVLSSCASPETTDCFDLPNLEKPKRDGECVAQGYLREQFDDYYFERTLNHPSDFLILDADPLERGFLSGKDGSWYEFSGRFLHLEGKIYRLEVHSPSDLKKIESR